MFPDTPKGYWETMANYCRGIRTWQDLTSSLQDFWKSEVMSDDLNGYLSGVGANNRLSSVFSSTAGERSVSAMLFTEMDGFAVNFAVPKFNGALSADTNKVMRFLNHKSGWSVHALHHCSDLHPKDLVADFRKEIGGWAQFCVRSAYCTTAQVITVNHRFPASTITPGKLHPKIGLYCWIRVDIDRGNDTSSLFVDPNPYVVGIALYLASAIPSALKHYFEQEMLTLL